MKIMLIAAIEITSGDDNEAILLDVMTSRRDDANDDDVDGSRTPCIGTCACVNVLRRREEQSTELQLPDYIEF